MEETEGDLEWPDDVDTVVVGERGHVVSMDMDVDAMGLEWLSGLCSMALERIRFLCNMVMGDPCGLRKMDMERNSNGLESDPSSKSVSSSTSNTPNQTNLQPNLSRSHYSM